MLKNKGQMSIFLQFKHYETFCPLDSTDFSCPQDIGPTEIYMYADQTHFMSDLLITRTWCDKKHLFAFLEGFDCETSEDMDSLCDSSASQQEAADLCFSWCGTGTGTGTG